MPELASPLLERLGELSLQGGVLVLLALGLTWLLRRGPAEARHVVWLIVVLRLAVPVGLSSPLGVVGAASDPSFLAELAPIVETGPQRSGSTGRWAGSPPPATADTALPPGSERSKLHWSAPAAVAGWGLGVLAFLAIVVVQIGRAHRRIHPAPPPPDALAREVATLARRLGVARPRIRVPDRRVVPASPALFGLLRPTLVLPRSMALRWSPEEREPLIVHELVHLKRRDLWVNWLQLAVQALFWFHPLVWLANRRLRIERELACDEQVAQFYGAGSGRYARALLRVARDPSGALPVASAVGLAESRSLLGDRVRRLATGARSRRATRLASAAAVAAGIALVAVASARSAPVSWPSSVAPTTTVLDAALEDRERRAALEAEWLELVRTGAGDPVELQRALGALRAARFLDEDGGLAGGLQSQRAERRAWLERVERLPDDPPTLRAAAMFFMVEDPTTAELLLVHGWRLQPDEPHWPLELARWHRLSSIRALDTRAGARRALTLYRLALPRVDDKQATQVLGTVARTAFDAGELAEARRAARRLLDDVERLERDWNYGNALHQGHTVLGLVALAEGDRAGARHHLLRSAETPGSPQLGSFGPSMRLAADLLAVGERDVVLDYLARCRSFWSTHFGELDAWAETIRRGGEPAFRNLYR